MTQIIRQKFENIYDEFRTLVLNKEYYSRRIGRSRKILLFLDVFLAVFAAGSGILSFGLWKQSVFGFPLGPILLAIATGAALVLAITRPYLKLEDEHERIASIQGAYAALAYVAEDVVRSVRTNGEVNETAETMLIALRQVRASLIGKEDTPPDRKLIDEMEKIVNQRHPPESFFFPPDAST